MCKLSCLYLARDSRASDFTVRGLPFHKLPEGGHYDNAEQRCTSRQFNLHCTQGLSLPRNWGRRLEGVAGNTTAVPSPVVLHGDLIDMGPSETSPIHNAPSLNVQVHGRLLLELQKVLIDQ